MRTYTASSLVKTYKAARTWAPDAPFVAINDGWGTVLTASEWLEWFREKLMVKIHRHDPLPRGRKHSTAWQMDCSRLARMLKGNYYTRVSDCPRELRSRLAHRLHAFHEED